MSIVKVNKSGLDTAAGDLITNTTSLSSEISSITSTLDSLPSHSEFSNAKAKASLIAASLRELNTDYTNLSDNIKAYIDGLKAIDAEGFDTSPEALAKLNDVVTSLGGSEETPVQMPTPSIPSGGTHKYSYSTGPNGTTPGTFPTNKETGVTTLVYTTVSGNTPGTVDKDKLINLSTFVETEEGKEITVPAGLGSVHTYMAWQLITAKNSPQYKLKESAGMNFDSEGFGRIGDRYVVATTTTFGQVGDLIDVYKEDGTVIKCIIGDIKSQNDANCNEWGHLNGKNVIEFIVDKSTWYNCGHPNPGTAGCHPEWNQNITKVVNKGNYFDLIDNLETVTV